MYNMAGALLILSVITIVCAPMMKNRKLAAVLSIAAFVVFVICFKALGWWNS